MKISGTPSNRIPSPDFADIRVIRQWAEDPGVKGIVITGEGRHFSTGADLEYFVRHETGGELLIHKMKAGRAILDYLEGLEKPVIASIDGACFGAGLEIALACHIRFCSKGALFCWPEINHGIIPGLGGVERLCRIAGRAGALELLLTGDVFNAQAAWEAGIVNRVAEGKSALNHTLEVLNRILDRGEKPVSCAIRAVNNAWRMNPREALEEECRMFADLVMQQYGVGVDDVG